VEDTLIGGNGADVLLEAAADVEEEHVRRRFRMREDRGVVGAERNAET
jgi:hypothetical protein